MSTNTQHNVVVEIAGRTRRGRLLDTIWNPSIEDPTPEYRVAIGASTWIVDANDVVDEAHGG